MCGRFALWAGEEEITARFHVTAPSAMRTPSWNIAPGSLVTVITESLEPASGDIEVRSAPRVRTAHLMEWGLRPHWVPEAVRPHINARAESVTERPTFRMAALHRRCLVPANGHYEWERPDEGGVRRRARTRPHFFRDTHGGLLAYAGIHEEWVDPRTGEVRGGMVVLTRSAPDEHGRIHPRCPLVLPAALWDAWLDPGLTDPRDVRTLVDAVPLPHLVMQEVDPRVGSTANDGPWLLGTGSHGRPPSMGGTGGIGESAPALFDL